MREVAEERAREREVCYTEIGLSVWWQARDTTTTNRVNRTGYREKPHDYFASQTKSVYACIEIANVPREVGAAAYSIGSIRHSFLLLLMMFFCFYFLFFIPQC